MIAVGIDISKAKSTVAVIDSDGTVLASPFTMAHTQPEMEAFVTYLKGLGEPTTILMEYTGHYHLLSRVYHISQRKNIFIYENLTVLLRTASGLPSGAYIRNMKFVSSSRLTQ